MGNDTALIWDAEDYTKSNGAQCRDAKETIEQIVKDGANKKDMVVVDIGCGSGNVTKMLTKSLSPKKVFASDFDAQMVKYASEKCADEKIEYFVQDISVPWDDLDERLKNLEGKVDLVWSNRVLHWVPDKATAIKTIGKLLKPGGTCYINVTLNRDMTEFDEEADKKKYHKYFHLLTNKEQADNWDSYFKNSGLSEFNIEFIEKDWTFDSKEQKRQMFQSTSFEPFFEMRSKKDVQNSSKEERAAVMKILSKKSTDHFATPYGKNPGADIDSDNQLTVYYEQFRIIGTK